MNRVNQYNFYTLGTVLHPLADVKVDTTVGEIYPKLYWAKQWLEYLLKDLLVPLRVSKQACIELLKATRAILEGASTAEGLKKQLGVQEFSSLTQGLRTFEIVFSAELQTLDTYFVSQKGIYSTSDLIERADRLFPDELRANLTREAIADIQQAGRCIAFDLPTAAGFHILRAAEAMVRHYCAVVTSQPVKQKTRNWAVYVKVLGKHGADNKILAVLDQIREMHRNPLFHPEDFLSMDEAITLLGVAQGAIVAIVEDIKKRQQAQARAASPSVP